MNRGAGVLVLLVCSGWTAEALAICRIVEEPGAPKPIVLPDQAVLFVKHRDVVVGQDCAPDAGPRPDASSDAGPGADAGDPPSADAGSSDAGASDAGTACEEIRGDAITMVVQPRFVFGPEGARFALLMVTPTRPIVRLESTSLFKELAIATGPEIWIEPVYIEDPALGYQCNDPKWGGRGCGGGYSAGGGGGFDPPPPPDEEILPDDAVQLDTIGAYEVARLSLDDVDQLAAWLTENNYVFASTDLDAARPYVDAGWTVVAVRIASNQPHDGGLEPLALSWAGSEIRLPLGISRQPAPAEAWLTVYVSAAGRYDFPGAQIPYARWQAGSFMQGGDFLTRNNLWVDLSLGAESDPVATLVPGSPSFQELDVVEQKIRIPSSDCPGRDDDDDPTCGCSTRHAPTPGNVLLFAVCALALGARWRRR